jgi:hypothetical protein
MTLETFVKENNWLPRGGFMDFGWGNGYVIVPKEHPMHGKHYDEINEFVEVNGGLTFSDRADSILVGTDLDVDADDWVVGFDTAHSWDTLSRWPKEKVERETNRLRLQLEKLVK